MSEVQELLTKLAEERREAGRELQSEKRMEDCGCGVDYGPLGLAARGEEGISYCDMHRAAEELLAALAAMLEPCSPGVHDIGPDCKCPEYLVEVQVRAAIAAAKGEA